MAGALEDPMCRAEARCEGPDLGGGRDAILGADEDLLAGLGLSAEEFSDEA